MSRWYPDDFPADRLREAWESQGPGEALALAKRLCQERPADPWPYLFLGRMQLAAGAQEEAVAPLVKAAQHSATRAHALLSLAGCAPAPVLSRIVVLFATLAPQWQGRAQSRLDALGAAAILGRCSGSLKNATRPRNHADARVRLRAMLSPSGVRSW